MKKVHFKNISSTCWVIPLLLMFIPRWVSGQDEEGVFWGEENYYGEEDTLIEDTLGGEYYYEGEDTLGEEYYYEEDTLGEEYYGEGDEYLYGGEEEGGELSDIEFAEEAKREGYTIQVTLASPGYVNHTLQTWNSFIDFRASVDLPFLLQIGPIKYRIGAEIASYSFENSLPVGGKFKGVGILGILSFPAGPSTVQFGAGVMGSSPTVIASQSFGLSIANLIDLRIGVRSTMAFNLPTIFEEGATNASWLDGFVAVGYTL